jgi:hypothetical protein
MRARAALLFSFVFAVGTCSLFACNALLDNEDRVVDKGRDTGGRDRESDDARVDPTDALDEKPTTIDGGSDAKPIVIDVPLNFVTPNGAQFQSTDAGTTITGFSGAVNHPVIVPLQQPAIPSDDYTVHATIRAATKGEFGIMTRIQPDGGAGYVLGSMFGQTAKAFIGYMGNPDWAPTLDSSGPLYTFTTNTRYFMAVQASKNIIQGKMWKEGENEPDWQLGITNAIYKTGKGVGFYVYYCYDAALESLRVTIP